MRASAATGTPTSTSLKASAASPDQRTFAGMISDAGFASVAFTNFTGGVAALHSGRAL